MKFSKENTSKKNKHNQTVGSTVERTDDRITETGEVFTPPELCKQMVDEIPLDIIKNPESTFLDNSAGSGNFIIALLNRLKEYHSEEHIVNNMLYVIEIMEDNHKEICEKLGVPVDHPHYVCDNALTYDYSFGKPVGVEAFLTS